MFSLCNEGPPNQGLSPGVHEVQMIARLPGLPDVTFESDVVEIDLDCSLLSDGESGEDGATEGGESGSFVVETEPAGERGCACASEGGGSGHAGGAALGLFMLAWCRRRRAR